MHHASTRPPILIPLIFCVTFQKQHSDISVTIYQNVDSHVNFFGENVKSRLKMYIFAKL